MKIKFTDIELAFDFVSSEQPGIHTVIVSRSRAETYYHTEIGDNFDEIPEDVPIAKDPENMKKLKDYSEKYSPAFHLDRFYPRAILFQIGGRDIHFNGENVKKFCDTLGPYYEKDPERLKLIVHDNVAHEFTQPMWNNAMDWFQKYLTHDPIESKLD